MQKCIGYSVKGIGALKVKCLFYISGSSTTPGCTHPNVINIYIFEKHFEMSMMGTFMHGQPFGEAALFPLVSMEDTPIQIYNLGTHLTMDLWAHNLNFVTIYCTFRKKGMIESGCKFAHAMTAELSWHVQNCDLNWWLFLTWTKCIFAI